MQNDAVLYVIFIRNYFIMLGMQRHITSVCRMGKIKLNKQQSENNIFDYNL
jgi:hypothetical protein